MLDRSEFMRLTQQTKYGRPRSHGSVNGRELSARVAQVLVGIILVMTIQVSASDAIAENRLVDGLTAARLEAARLYAKAMLTAERHEKARREVDRQMQATRSLGEELSSNREKFTRLRELGGHIATMQYRNAGISLTAKLLLSSDSTDSFIHNLAAAHNADEATRRVAQDLREARKRLIQSEKAATEVLHAMRENLKRMRAAKRRVAQELSRAEEWVRQLEAQENPLGIDACGQTFNRRPVASGPKTAGTVSKWVMPVHNYKLSSGFAAIGPHWRHQHTGQDFAVKTGTPVQAVGDGVVISAGCEKAFGNSVIVQHPNGYFTQYAHLSTVNASEGRRVRAGQQIGQSGCTGNCTGPHLHFEVRIRPTFGSAVDPIAWLRERGVIV